MNTGYSAPFRTGSIVIEGAAKISYIDEGSGDQTILFIHGLANYALAWKKNIEHLRQQYRCIAIDLPGNGNSDRGAFPYGISYFAGIIARFIEALGLEKVTLAGHSMGGQIAITTLLNHPAAAEKMILCAPAGFEVFTPWEAGIFQTSISIFDYFSSEEHSLSQTIRNSFYNYAPQAEEMVRDLVGFLRTYPLTEYRRMIQACIHGMLHEPVYNSLHLIRQPALVLFGERDALIPTRALHPTTTKHIAEDGTARMPDARLHLIPECGHFLQWEKHETVNSLIQAFLQ